MKKQFKKYLKVILFSCFIVLTGCERNLYEDGIPDKTSEIKLSDVSLSTLDSKTAEKINSKISFLKKEIKKKKMPNFNIIAIMDFT
jgi:hypothetical protein